MFVVPAFAGTTDSGALNFKASFNITTELLHGISVDRLFPGQPCAFAEALYNPADLHRSHLRPPRV